MSAALEVALMVSLIVAVWFGLVGWKLLGAPRPGKS
jgi:hypothetical protein